MSTGISSPSNLPVGPIQASEPTLAEQHVEKQAILDALVNRVVDETVFPKKQFIVLEKEMDATSKLAITCLQALRMERSRWDEVKGLVRKKLGTKRNNSLARVRRSLLRCFEKDGIASIELRKVLLLRKDRESFHWFLDNIASVIVGKAKTEKAKCLKPPREWLSRSLEAFSLLCLENYFDMVKSEARKDRNKDKPLWTADARGKKKNQGWDQAGIRRYNQLIEIVRENRRMYPEEDDIYLEMKRKDREDSELQKLRRKKENLEWKERGLEAAADDFSSDSDSE